MLRYKTKTRPGLVALYDIRPGNEAGPFLQPRSPHGVKVTRPLIHGLNVQGRCSGDNENVLGGGNYCYIAYARHWGAHVGRRGAAAYHVACLTYRNAFA